MATSKPMSDVFSSPLKPSSLPNFAASPLSNLKLLTDVACAEYLVVETALSQPSQSTTSPIVGDENASPVICGVDFGEIHLEPNLSKPPPATQRRGEKLTEICARFLSMLPLRNLSKEQRPLLEMSMLEKSLGVERRRLYDILNILESLSIVEKSQKNCMRWNGTSKLAHTLKRLKSLSADQFCLDDLCYIMDDLAYRKIYAETCSSTAISSEEVDAGYEEVFCACSRRHCNDSGCKMYDEDSVRQEVQEQVERAVSDESCPNVRRNSHDEISSYPSAAASPDKADRPLGIICQRFLILLLLQKHPRALSMQSALKLMKLDLMRQVERAGLFKPSSDSLDLSGKVAEMEAKKFGLIKTRLRRLYDVCNVLTALGIVRRARLIRFEMDCVSGFVYSGPEPEMPPAVTPSPLVGSRQSLLSDLSPPKDERTGRKTKHDSGSSFTAKTERRRGKFVRHLSLDDLGGPSVAVRVPSSASSLTSSSTSQSLDNSGSILKTLLTPASTSRAPRQDAPPATVHIGSTVTVNDQTKVSVPGTSTLKRHRSDGVVVLPANPAKVKIVYVRPNTPLYSSLVASASGVHVMTASQLRNQIIIQQALNNQKE